MKIAIDMLACQTDSRHRGIGRYVYELVRAITRNERRVDPILLIDGCNTARMREARRQIRDLDIDASAYCLHYPAHPADVPLGNIDVVNKAVGLLRSRQIQALQPDAVLVTSFFEGFHGGFGASSELDMEVLAGIPTAVVAYDLIPLIFPERYLPDGSDYSAWYHDKLDKFKRFDLYLAISEATKNDLVNLLGIDPARIHVIGAGYRAGEPLAQPLGRNLELSKFGIDKPFVLTVGNADWRKNNIAALECFSRLPKRVRERHQLVLTQAGQDVVQALANEHADIAGSVLVLGQVDDDVLSTLYAECSAFFFPSYYEGFGLPIIEAMAHGAPVVSSSAGALAEVMFDPETLFEADDIDSGTRLLERVLTDVDFRHRLAEAGPAHASTFTWERCARLALDALSSAPRRNEGDSVGVGCGDPDGKQLPVDAWSPSEDDIGLMADAFCVLGRGAQPRIEEALASVLKGRRRRILVDVSCVAATDAWTGIQRVVRNYCIGLAALSLKSPELELHLISFNDAGLRYADEFGVEKLGLMLEPLAGEVQVLPDDLVFMLDSTWENPDRFDALVDAVWQKGGEVIRMVYDLVPILYPQTCHPGMPPVFRHWMEHAVARTDGVICISEAVRQDLEDFMDAMEGRGALPFRPWTRAVHLGADLESGRVSEPGMVVQKLLETAEGHPLLLVVGTVEPRKDHATVLAAFDELWKGGHEPVLVVVGKQGWNVDALATRMREHSQAGKHFFWLDHASDGDLDALMARADALIQASIAEGFGLPIVEAGSKGVPLMLSDIPVFREIAGDEAVYFRVGDSKELSSLIIRGMKSGWVQPHEISTLSWEQSSMNLLDAMLPPSVQTRRRHDMETEN